MQNKGAVRLFAILMALACIFYLSFSFITRGVEKDAKEFADKYASRGAIKDSATKYAKGDAQKIKFFVDSFHLVSETRYLDSMRKLPVFNLWPFHFSYEDCKEKEINLGLDLRGGMNVTLEVSVQDIIGSMSNKPKDPRLLEALANTVKKERTDNRDFTTIFGEELKRVDKEHPVSFYFRSINEKDITAKSTDDEVLSIIRKTVTQAINTAEQTLGARINRFGVSQPTIQKLGSSGRILIELPGISDKVRVRRLLQGTANLEFWETFNAEEMTQYLLPADKRISEIFFPNANIKDTTKVDTNKTAIDTGKTKTVSNKPPDTSKKVTANAPDTNPNKVDTNKLAVDSNKLRQEQHPLFSIFSPNFDEKGKPLPYMQKCVLGACNQKDTSTVNKFLSLPEVHKLFPSNVKFAWGNKGAKYNENFMELYLLKITSKDGKAALYGDIISRASKTTDQKNGGNFSVEMQMKDDAAQKWKIITGANAPHGEKGGNSIAIVLDNQVYSAPTVQGEIAGGNSQITGDFGSREADDLANILSAGKLPAPAHIVEEQVVGPTLGAENIRDGFLSFGIALLLVLVFMALYYNKAGVVADAALFVNLFFIMGVLASLGAVLTLPGIAGIVLTIGMSVDANILIFERIREELASGKGIALAIQEGYKNAMSSIIDSNVTTLLLGLILYAYGSGPVQGFATTLIIGILTSLFSAIFISRLIFERMLKKKADIPFGNKRTMNTFKNANINFVKNRKFYYIFSSVIIAFGVAMFFKKGFSLGVDFKGGRSFIVQFDKPQETESVSKALNISFNDAANEVKTFGTDNSVKITTTYLITDPDTGSDRKVENKLAEGLKTLNNHYVVKQSNKVGETISRDIRNSSFLTVLFSCVVMFFFILIRFKKWQYGLGATVALFHDVLIVLSCYTIFNGILPFSLEVNQDFIAAILTVMAYSMTDTVVVFDRIREYLANNNKKDLDAEERKGVINYALNATLSRTIITSLTIFVVLLAIFVFGGDVIRGFAFALLIGIVIGTYSSLCIATPVVVDFDKGDKKIPAK